MELKEKLHQIRIIARYQGWIEIDYQPINRMISFKRDGVRLNYYYTTGTVGTAMNHPVKGPTQLFRKNVNFDQLCALLKYPRKHTGKGYYNHHPRQMGKNTAIKILNDLVDEEMLKIFNKKERWWTKCKKKLKQLFGQ